MTGPFLTIATSAFNDEQYLEDSVKNVLRQSYTDFELIIVNDGSTDESGRICNDLKRFDSRVRVIHKENGGLATARNAAIENARGRYILFFDVDDVVADNAFSRIVTLLDENDWPQVLIWSYDEINPSLGTTTELVLDSLVCHSNDEVKEAWPRQISSMRFNNGFVWNKAYSLEFLRKHDIRFDPLLRIQQDEAFNNEVYRYIDRLVTVPDILYHYYVRSNGSARQRHIANRLDIYDRVRQSFFELMSWWHLEDKEMQKYLHLRFFNGILSTADDICTHFTGKERTKHLDKLVNDPRVKACLVELKRLGCTPQSGCNKLYWMSIEKGSAKGFYIVNRTDKFITRGKQTVKSLIKR